MRSSGPGGVAARLPRVAVGEMPGQQQRDVAALAGRHRRASRPARPSARRWLWAASRSSSAPSAAEVVPEIQQRHAPPAAVPRRPARHAVARRRRDGDGAPGRGASRRRRPRTAARRSAWSAVARGVAIPARAGTARSPFQSVAVAAPSTPMKLGRLIAALAVTARARRLRSVTVKTASGMPLASGSAGTSGLNAFSSTSSGTSGSDSITRPNGIGRRESTRCETRQVLVRRPARRGCLRTPRSGLGPSSRRHTARLPVPPARTARGTDRPSPDCPAGHEALGRAVHDLPVAQVAPAAERHGARADAAKRQRDAVEVSMVVRRAATATTGRRARPVGAARCAASASRARGRPARPARPGQG